MYLPVCQLAVSSGPPQIDYMVIAFLFVSLLLFFLYISVTLTLLFFFFFFSFFLAHCMLVVPVPRVVCYWGNYKHYIIIRTVYYFFFLKKKILLVLLQIKCVRQGLFDFRDRLVEVWYLDDYYYLLLLLLEDSGMAEQNKTKRKSHIPVAPHVSHVEGFLRIRVAQL